MKRLTAFTFILALLSACQQNNKESDANAAVSFSRDSLLEDIRILASDSFQGRKPFTKGEDLTVSFLTNKFQSFGLEPGNGSSFVQEVPLVEITPNPAPELLISAPKGNFKLKNRQDYVLTTQNTDSVVHWDNDELIFAGYGVVAPEYNWNDYAGIDVKGKIVLVMVNDPGYGTADSTLFKGKAMTYYGRWTYKYEEAARQGAKGCLIIHNTAAASYPFSVVQNSWGSSNLYMDNRQSPSYNVPLKGWITGSAAKKILAGAGKDTSLLASAKCNCETRRIQTPRRIHHLHRALGPFWRRLRRLHRRYDLQWRTGQCQWHRGLAGNGKSILSTGYKTRAQHPLPRGYSRGTGTIGFRLLFTTPGLPPG